MLSNFFCLFQVFMNKFKFQELYENLIWEDDYK